MIPRISIIIPIYNVATELTRCLASVAAQTFTDYEVIMVNDGSTDDSVKIAQEFVNNDLRFRLIHQENRGLSGARNSGLLQATGDYIFYLDSDDQLEKTALEKLVNTALKYNADIVQLNFYYDYPNYLLYADWFSVPVKIYNQRELINAVIEQKEVKNFAWGKLIKSDIAKKFTFPEGKFFEDTLWMMQLANEVETGAILKEPLMYYLQRGTSISGSFSLRNLDQLCLLDERLQYVQHNAPEEYQKTLESFFNVLCQHQKLASSLPADDFKKYSKIINYYLEKYNLEEMFQKEQSSLINKMRNLANRAMNRFFPEVSWIKIKKPNHSE